jgi:DNA-binding transcriptional LysR family regulator
LVVIRAGSFADAGEKIGLTQSAVSAQMKRLEEVLGVEIFERSGRSAKLNKVGRAAVAKAEQIVALFESMGSELENSVLQGTIRLGAIATVQTGLLPIALTSFQHSNPGVLVRIVPGSSVELLSHVDSGEMDAAIMVEPPFLLPKELRWQPLLRESFVLIAPKDIRGNDWRKHMQERRFIRYDRAAFGGRLVNRFLRRFRISTHDTAELDDLAAIVSMVREGLGIAIVPASTGLSTAGLRAIDFGADVFHRQIGAVLRTEVVQDCFPPFLQRLLAAARSDPHVHPQLKGRERK